MSATFFCPRCETVKGRNELIEVRRESRDAKQMRRHVVLIEKICRTCDDAEVERLRPTTVPNVPDHAPSALFPIGEGST